MTDERIRPATPRGFRDILFQETAERKAVSQAMLRAAASWGYSEVETPVLERYETLQTGAGNALEGDVFRLFDLDGGLLALRPEMTVPIARLVASRLADETGPHRISYVADVFREHASYRGQYRQFTQFGMEFVGASGPEADAETIAVMVEALEVTGLTDFHVGVGTVGILRALLEAADTEVTWRDAVMETLHERNLVGLDTLVGDADLTPEIRDALVAVPRLRGGREIIDECRRLVEPCGCTDAVDGLAQVWGLLDAAGVAERVTVDFGIVRSFDYYTGIVLEAYTSSLGLPLGGGGRYDSLLTGFGAPMPAAGFALGLERVHIACADQGRVIETPALDAVVGGPDPQEVFATARRLRQDGETVVVSAAVDRDTLSAGAAELGAGRVLWIDGGER